MIIKAIIVLIVITLGALIINKLTSSNRLVSAKPKSRNSTYKKHTSDYPVFMNTVLLNLGGQQEQYLFMGGYKQADKLFLIRNGRLIDVSRQTGLINALGITYCAIAADANNDGLPDLFVARDDGFYLYENHQGVFTVKKLHIDFPEGLIPVSMAIADLQKMGMVDLFITAYPKSSTPILQQTSNYQSFLFKNQGDNTFINVTEQLGLDAFIRNLKN